MSPHQAGEFRNSVEYTATVTFVVAGGARQRTAHRRARKLAERLANTAARATGVVDVRAVAGPSRHGEVATGERVRFDAANTGQGSVAEPGRLDRYLDPGHERALASLAEANAAAEHRRQADLTRRRAVGCANPSQLLVDGSRPCGCAYCLPATHLDELCERAAGHGLGPPRCVCGRHTGGDGRCAAHRGHRLVVLDGDPDELARLADLQRRESPGRDRPEGPTGPALPGLDR